MDEEILEIIKRKLENNNLPKFECLTDKQKERLKRLEVFINGNKKKCSGLVDEIKGLRLTKVCIANSKEVSLSRKTLYNDEILLKYIEASILEQVDYFNEGKLSKLEEDFNCLEEQYDKLLNNIIEFNSMKFKIKQYEEEVKLLEIKNENLLKSDIEIKNGKTNIINYSKAYK